MDDVWDEIQKLLAGHEKLHGASYKNIRDKSIFRRKEILEQLRPIIERQISLYLPGYKFRDLTRFGWHLNREQYYQRFIEWQQMPPAYFINNWIRRFIVPTMYDYLSEVARALQEREAQHRHNSKLLGLPKKHMGWTPTMRQWLDIKDVDLGYQSSRMKPKTWNEYLQNPSDDTLYRWARQACEKRQKRTESDPPNYWRIRYVVYSGGQLHDIALAKDSVGLVDTGYLEGWSWAGPSSLPSPERTSISCVTPAAREVWTTSDRKFRIQ